MNWPSSANSMMLASSARISRVVKPKERGAQVDILAAGQLLVEADAQPEQRGHAPLDANDPGRRLEYARDDPEEGRVARAIGPDEPEHLARLHGETDVVQRPELLPSLAQVRAKQAERSFLQEVLALRAQGEGFADTGALDHRRHQSSSAKRG